MVDAEKRGAEIVVTGTRLQNRVLMAAVLMLSGVVLLLSLSIRPAHVYTEVKRLQEDLRIK